MKIYDSKYLEFSTNVFQIIGPQLKHTHTEQSLLDEIKNITDFVEPEEYEDKEFSYIETKIGKYKYFAFGSVIGFIIFYSTLFLSGLTKGSKGIDINNRNK